MSEQHPGEQQLEDRQQPPDKQSSGEQPPGEQQPAEAPPLSYEEAREGLVDVVRRLEAGGTTLEDSLALWERGEHLAQECQRWLDGARAKLEDRTSAADR